MFNDSYLSSNPNPAVDWDIYRSVTSHMVTQDVNTTALPSPCSSLKTGAYQKGQLDDSFSLEPITAYSHFQRCLVVAGTVLCWIEILQEKMSFPYVKPTQVRPTATFQKQPETFISSSRLSVRKMCLYYQCSHWRLCLVRTAHPLT